MLTAVDLPRDACIGAWHSPDQADLWHDLRIWAKTSWDRERAQVRGGRVDLTVKDSWDTRLDTNPQLYQRYCQHIELCREQYHQAWPDSRLAPLVVEYPIMLQDYPPGGAYHQWHCERAGRGVNRSLVFMTYLTDVHEGGETEWRHWDLRIQPREGLTVIWPADWTWMHRGLPTLESKIIATGWWVFK